MAAKWLSENRQLFTESVDEPFILRRNDAEIAAEIQQQIAFGDTYDEIRDYLMFDFQNEYDIRLFLRLVRQDMNCAVHVCLQGREYIMNKTNLNQMEN